MKNCKQRKHLHLRNQRQLKKFSIDFKELRKP